MTSSCESADCSHWTTKDKGKEPQKIVQDLSKEKCVRRGYRVQSTASYLPWFGFSIPTEAVIICLFSSGLVLCGVRAGSVGVWDCCKPHQVLRIKQGINYVFD